ncbi:TldD/PmbA family protein [Methanoregula formicica]|uniref:TldD/PmbA family protein n=1 Tax=Methanoregula formicica TaxID=882104 RepID=UPI001F1C4699|nr:TldD/PmbA family protein [Methanoregula formicica]
MAVEWIDQLIREAEKSVDEVEVFYVAGTSVSADLRKKKVSHASTSEDCGLGVRTIHKGRIGSSSTSDPGRWRECLKAAIASGNLATPQEWKGLPGPEPLDQTSLSFDRSLEVGPATAGKLLEAMLEGAAEHPAEVTSGSAGVSALEVTLASSHGVRYTSRHTSVSLSLEAIYGQSTGYEFDHSWALDRVDPVTVGERATFFACESAKGKDIPSGDYDILLSPLAYAELLGTVFVPALSGRNVHAKRSRLADSLDQKVADPLVSMYDDPLIPGADGSSRWDAEGMPTKRIDFILDGVLCAFAYDLKTAYRYGKQSTANAVRGGYGGSPSIGHHNFVLDGKRDTVDDERVVFVHNVVGAHTANPMSGEFSVELSNAFFREGGEFQEPIRSAMLSGNVFDLQHQITGLSRESRTIGSLILPSVRINQQRLIGK